MAAASAAQDPARPIVHRDWFRQWFDSPFYHALYFQHNEAEATAFIDRLLQALQPPPGAALLDVACGRGRHSRILASKGYEVTGIDLAPSSISYAGRYANDHLRFFVHDMRQLLCTNCFQYAFNFFTSFGYFETRRENYNAIRMVAIALQPKGIFVLDYLNPEYAERRLVPGERKIIDDHTYDITRWCDGKHFFKRIVINGKDLPQPLEFTERVAMFTLEDFRAFFEPNGLHIRQVYGNYELAAFDREHSPRQIIIAEKR